METSNHSRDPLDLLKEGDEEAFSNIYNEYWDKLYYLAYQKLQCQHAAEEIVQEVFLALWKKRAGLTIDSLPGYLAAMVRRAVYRHSITEKNAKHRESIFQERQEQFVFFDKNIDDKMILERLLELSNHLPEKCGLIFKSNKLEDQSLADIAKRLNISQKTAEAHLTKALKSIRLDMRRFMSFLF